MSRPTLGLANQDFDCLGGDSFTIGRSPVPYRSHPKSYYHEGKQVMYAAKHASAAQIKDQLIVKTAQDYCWMWSNIRLPFRIDVQLVKAR